MLCQSSSCGFLQCQIRFYYYFGRYDGGRDMSRAVVNMPQWARHSPSSPAELRAFGAENELGVTIARSRRPMPRGSENERPRPRADAPGALISADRL